MSGRKHTVEKIGGTSMSQFEDVMKNIIIGSRKGGDLYNRVFVVSAYGGITDMLLEHKKSGEAGVYAKFAQGDKAWKQRLEHVRKRMIELNSSFENIGLDLEKANGFVNERIDGIKSCLNDLIKLRSFGHFTPSDYLPASREFLSAVGEAHSAYNATLILQANGINAVFIDLSGWKEAEQLPFDEVIKRAFQDVCFEKEMPVVTGYTKCVEGIMNKFDRGYSEITFSKTAVITNAMEGIIHKEYHLSTGDPKLIGLDKVVTIGRTNFDIADQLSDMGMEAIHPKASKEMESSNIPIRVKNTFEPDNPGTLISHDYVSPEPRVEMVCGRKDLIAIEVFDSDMVGESGYDYKLLKNFAECGVSYIAKNTNANTITHYVSERSGNIPNLISVLKLAFPDAQISTKEVAVASVIGSNMKNPGFLYRAAKALAENDINVLALDQSMRQVNMQFMIERADYTKAIISLHRELVEKLEPVGVEK